MVSPCQIPVESAMESEVCARGSLPSLTGLLRGSPQKDETGQEGPLEKDTGTMGGATLAIFDRRLLL